MINVEQRLESTSLDLQEGLEYEFTELTSSTLNSHGGVLESTSTDSLVGRTVNGESKALKKE